MNLPQFAMVRSVRSRGLGLGLRVMMRDVSDHQQDDFVLLSGTRVREMLSAGKPLPPEFARPEVSRILMDHYRAG